MKTHETDETCPFCGNAASLTTEWGWIDNSTCTATLCCPTCRTDSEHAEDAVAVVHRGQGGMSRDDCEQLAIAAVLDIGLPA